MPRVRPADRRAILASLLRGSLGAEHQLKPWLPKLDWPRWTLFVMTTSYRARLAMELASLCHVTRPPDREVGDEADAAMSNVTQHETASVRERQWARARLVRLAIARIDSDTFGACFDCGDEIPMARLTADPAAERCVRCQERREFAAERGLDMEEC